MDSCCANWRCPSSFQRPLTHHWVSFSTDQRFDGSVLQRQGADGAAFAISNIQAAPGLLWGQSQARGLCKASLVGVGIVTVFLVATSCPAHAGTSLGLTVQKKKRKQNNKYKAGCIPLCWTWFLIFVSKIELILLRTGQLCASWLQWSCTSLSPPLGQLPISEEQSPDLVGPCHRYPQHVTVVSTYTKVNQWYQR